MAFLAPILTIGGTLFSGVSALGQGLYQSQVAKNNAVIADRNANLASEKAQIEQQRSDREYAAQRGQVLAGAAASGVSTDSGSVGSVLGLVDRNRVEGATDIRRGGEIQSQNFNNQSAAYKGQASAAKSAGISSLIGSVFKAGAQGFDAFSGGGSGSGSLGPTRRRAYPADWSLNG